MKDSPTAMDRILSIVSVCGLVVLAFLYGAAALHYRLPLSQQLTNAFSAADAWYDEWIQSARWQSPSAEISNNITQRDEFIIQNAKIHWDKDLAHAGYTMVTTGYLSSPYLVDMEGRIIYRWNIPIRKIWPSSTCINPFKQAHIVADTTHLFPNGDLLISYVDATFGAPYGCGLVKVDKDSKILWVYKANTHHDFTVDKEGNIYAITRKTITEPPPGFEGLVYPMSNDLIVKLSPEGKELDSISLLDAFHGTPFELMMFHGNGNGDNEADFFHTNSVDVLSDDIADKFPSFKAKQILVSIRTIGALAVIDPETRKVVWAYRGFWQYQHAASFLPNGHILVLDNMGHIEYKKPLSRIIEFDPVTLKTMWHYPSNRKQMFYTERKGRLQPLPGGNMLITDFVNARIFEITKEGKVVWTYALQKVTRKNPFANGILDAKRYNKNQLPFLPD